MKNQFIFDADETIFNTLTPFHATAECAVLNKRFNISITPEIISARFDGGPRRRVFQELVPDYNDYNSLVEEKWKIMYFLVSKNPIRCLPGMYELIKYLWVKNIPISIASAAPIHWIKECTEKSVCYDFQVQNPKLSKIFGDQIFSAQDCNNQKPAPDVFLKAQSRMKKTKGDTFVIGDARADVLGGTSAGFRVLYLSKENEEFDRIEKVKRFQNSLELSDYITKELV